MCSHRSFPRLPTSVLFAGFPPKVGQQFSFLLPSTLTLPFPFLLWSGLAWHGLLWIDSLADARSLRLTTNIFSCREDNNLKLPRSFLNDNYCDCRDGSDEPGQWRSLVHLQRSLSSLLLCIQKFLRTLHIFLFLLRADPVSFHLFQVGLLILCCLFKTNILANFALFITAITAV